jgi:hypothetical protein
VRERFIKLYFQNLYNQYLKEVDLYRDAILEVKEMGKIVANTGNRRLSSISAMSLIGLQSNKLNYIR